MSDIGIEHVHPSVLKPAPYNPRTMGADERKRLERGIKEFGLVDPIIARRSDNMVIGGHQRLAAAQTLGLETVPVVYLDDIADDRAAALNVLLNNPSAQGHWDLPKLTDILSELDGTGFDATLTGFDDEELRRLLAPTGGLLDGVDPDEVPDLPAEPITKPGDLITLGRHRLVCGDSTTVEAVDRALGGARPALMVTDPPYGVEYDPNWRNEAAAKGSLAYAPVRVGEVLSDDRSDWREAWALFPGDVVYCWHAGRHASSVQSSLEEAGFEIRNQVIWAKSNFPISRGHYHWRHEPCWYAVRRGSTANWIGDRKQTTLWEMNLDRNVEGGHSTQKPVEAMRRPLQNHEGDVYDPFLGSGTTLIAAEMMGRTCYGVELSPAYCDVIVSRWEKATGQKAVRPA